MPAALPHPETLFLTPAERGLVSPQPASPAPAPTPTITDKIQRLKKKRELAGELQTMLAQSGITLEELRDSLRAAA
ncbi:MULTISPECIES: hypothetical protein [Chitinibacter]|uniref:hypothetical protein n=1 Tax=Chitinibacter TaxID=230666 RepID=UPI0004199A06|nr:MULTISPECIES: hypothetical protein [Chitinibacter]